jgi:hypothetical protein
VRNGRKLVREGRKANKVCVNELITAVGNEAPLLWGSSEKPGGRHLKIIPCVLGRLGVHPVTFIL